MGNRWTRQDDKGGSKGRIARSLWTERDQDQNDHRKPHCCGVCQDSPGGDQGQGLI